MEGARMTISASCLAKIDREPEALLKALGEEMEARRQGAALEDSTDRKTPQPVT